MQSFLYPHSIGTGCLQQGRSPGVVIKWMGMDFVLKISEWSSLAVILVSLGTTDGCKMLSDVLSPAMTCFKVLPELDKHLEKNNVCEGRESEGLFALSRSNYKIIAVDH